MPAKGFSYIATSGWVLLSFTFFQTPLGETIPVDEDLWFKAFKHQARIN